MSYNNSATVYVTNNTGGNAIIVFSHEYSDDGAQIWTSSTPVAAGANAGPLTVGFNTGFLRDGQDYWFCGVNVLDGANPGAYSTRGSAENPTKQCTLESEDNGLILTFSVTTSNFVMTENSGTCTTSMSGSNAATVVAAKQPKNLPGSAVQVPASQVPQQSK